MHNLREKLTALEYAVIFLIEREEHKLMGLNVPNSAQNLARLEDLRAEIQLHMTEKPEKETPGPKVYTFHDYQDGTLSSDHESMVWLRERVDEGCKPAHDLLARLRAHPQLGATSSLIQEIDDVLAPDDPDTLQAFRDRTLRRVPPTPCCANCHHRSQSAGGRLLDQGCSGCALHQFSVGYKPQDWVCDSHEFPRPKSERERILAKLTPAERRTLGFE